jgi:hypothetical protein
LEESFYGHVHLQKPAKQHKTQARGYENKQYSVWSVHKVSLTLVLIQNNGQHQDKMEQTRPEHTPGAQVSAYEHTAHVCCASNSKAMQWPSHQTKPGLCGMVRREVDRV